jgi:hypothetical protein
MAEIGIENQAFDELRDSYARIRQARAAGMDPKELDERQEAAGAYSAENEKHFVDFLQDCVDTSYASNQEIREVQNDCWRTFKEKEPESYRFKEEWQSRVKIPKPFASVMYGAAAVQKAFSPEYLTIENESDKLSEAFWQKTLERQLDKRHANFITKFTDATVMALAVGQSMEVIPKYSSASGLSLELVEPWKIYRDPDAPPRNPQGGLYWIHQEWLDYHVLQRGEAAGKYENVARIKDVAREDPENPFMTKEALAHRRGQIWHRSKFRRMFLTSEFWGTILSPSGEVLLDGTYSVAAGRMIETPKQKPYSRLRWPGISFSAMPDVLSHGGRGLLEGVISLWESMSNLLCLHEDGLKFIVNPPTEINVHGLIDPEDIDDWPGKKYLTRDTVSGQQVVRTVERHDSTNSILANLQYHDQNFQRGSFVTDAVQGLPGWRKEITAREAAQNLDQAMGVFGLMGANLEDGAVKILDAIVDVLQNFAQPAELLLQVPEDIALAVNHMGGKLPSLTGSFSISGMQELLKETDTLRHLTTVVFPMASDPTWAPFIDRYKALKAYEARTNLKDEKLIVSPEQASAVQQSQPMGAPMDPAVAAVSGGRTQGQAQGG